MSSELPEIAGVQRFRYLPGDRFIVRVPGKLVYPEQVDDIQRYFRTAPGLPDDAPVAVISEDMDIEIVSPA